MSKINLIETVSINELRKLIPIVGKSLTPVIVSEPGVGKTSLLKMMEEDLGDKYDYIYVDCPVKDMSDIGMVIPDHESKTLHYYVADLFKLDSPKPKVILLDEFMKSPKLLQVIFTRLMLERMVGDAALPEGSIVFATSNNASDGVGDSMLAHAGNRVCIMRMAKPTPDEWLAWATENGISRVIRAWVSMFPRCLASYTDGNQNDNPYIYNPRKPQNAFVSPRSLATASNIVRSRKENDADSVIAALTGAIGESAARDMQAYIEFSDQLPAWESVIADPKTAKVPDGAGASAIIVFGAIAKITKDTITPFMTYLERFEPEWQACFAINIAKSTAKQSIAFSSPKFADWVQKNEDLL